MNNLRTALSPNPELEITVWPVFGYKWFKVKEKVKNLTHKGL